MPVSSWILTIAPAHEGEAFAALSADPHLAVGQGKGGRFPLVVSSESAAADARLIEQVRTTTGVDNAELVFVDFSDLDDAACSEWLSGVTQRRKHREVTR
jgi:nitrate reductase NapAB chaperone NapD